MRKRIASGCWKRGSASSSGHRLAERLPERDLDEVDADGVPDEVGHLPAGNPRRAPRRRRRRRPASAISCGNAIPSRRPSACTACTATRSGSRELVAVDRRRVDVDPADAEADARRAQPVGERDAAARSPSRAITIPFISVPSANASTIASPVGRLGERRVQVRVEVVGGLEAEDAALAARVGRLEHRREADRLERGARPRRGARTAAKRGCGTPASASVRRIATLCVIRCAVSVPIPGRPSASATAATTGTARSAETVSTPSTRVPARRLAHRVEVGEVDHLGGVGREQPGCLRVAVDRDDAQAELARLHDRAALVPAGADEEDGLHRAPMLVTSSGRRGPTACRPRRVVRLSPCVPRDRA